MIARAPPDFEVAIVGAGVSGIGMAIALTREGKRSFVVLEKADALGGTWRDNRYPGCACDIQSNLYSYSFAPNPNWTRLYPTQPEIRAYLEHVADRFDVRRHIRFNTALTRAAWDDAARLWRITTREGQSFTARALVSGMGGLHVPNVPALPGMETFAGESWHSAQWREDVALEGKRVAIIGAGASAVQIAPVIAPIVAQLDLYQRTPSWIVPKQDRAVGEDERRLHARAPWLQELKRRLIYLANELRVPMFMHPADKPGIVQRIAERAIVRAVRDPALREKVTPRYRVGCRRILISDDYYPALTRANVALIDSGATAITPRGVIGGDGVERAADIIVFATGFKPMQILADVEITGLGGRSLNAEWAEAPEAYLGTAIAGYPNFFTLMGPNSALGHNSMIYMIESQIAFVMDALRRLDAEGAAAVDVKAEAQRAFNAAMQAKLAKSVWGTGCTSWYLTPDGKNYTLWPDFTFRFRARTKRVRDADVEFLR